jgi:hypothetical protein
MADVKTYVRDVEVRRGVADVQHGHAHRLAPEPVPVVELQDGRQTTPVHTGQSPQRLGA